MSSKKKRERKEKYDEYMNSDVWQKVRQRAFDHYGSQCNRCDRPAQQVHHKSYSRFYGNELMEDLEVLCVPCHKKHHEQQDKIKAEKKKLRRENKKKTRHQRNKPTKNVIKRKPKGDWSWSKNNSKKSSRSLKIRCVD